MVTQVNMHEAKSQLSALVEKVLAGEKVTIARAGVPVVDLIVHQKPTVIFGLGKGEFEHDPDLFHGVDDEIQRLVYGDDA